MKVSSKPAEPLHYSLGIDAGCASIGWAIVELDDKGVPKCPHSAGVRRFEAGVEGDISRGRDESKSQQRREARGPRRNTWRRQWRLQKVFTALQQAGLLPETKSAGHDARDQMLAALDQQLIGDIELITDRISAHVVPYELRKRALDEPLPAFALGRALYHLAQRRGFLSNLKTGRGDDQEEQGKVKAGISELADNIDRAEARTLGEYFAGLDPEEQRIRQRWTSRQMYRDEFDQICNAQSAHHPQLAPGLREELEHAIFYQRPLKSQRGLIGKCDLEPQRRRAQTASLPFQHFRILQRVNDLKVESPLDLPRRLTADERSQLLIRLTTEGDLTWNEVKKTLGLKKTKKQPIEYQFNFEEDGDKKMLGNRTGSRFAEALGDTWDDMDERTQTALVDRVLTFEDEQPLIDHLQHQWKFSQQQAEAVANLPLEAGNGNISRRAINKLRPLLEQGTPYATARKKVYPESLESTEPAEFLEPFGKVVREVRNPTLTRTMAELRKVVNAIIAKHGKPAVIRIELARDLKRSRKDRDRLTKQRDENTQSRESAYKSLLETQGAKFATPHNILKWRLADECNWQCPFTGRSITRETLVGDSPQFDVEHIIPFSLSLDNSYLNKTLCYHDENRHVKKNQSPLAAYGSTDKWEEIVQRVQHFQGKAAKAKLGRFLTEELPDMDEFAERQLSDTRYLSRTAADYLATLYGGRTDGSRKSRVQASPGRLTAMLRRAWGLNNIGYGDPDLVDQKDRADHRHHAIDAFVVAVSSPAVVKAANVAASQAESYYDRDLLREMAPPWEGFDWKQVSEVIDGVTVSSRVDRKLNGSLHKDTIYSKPYKIADPKKPTTTKTVHHVRKPLAAMSRGEVDAIVDGAIRRAVIEKLEALTQEDKKLADPKKAFADENNHPYLTSKKGRLIPIHRARIRVSVSTIDVGSGSRLRRVAPGENHHMEIVAVLDGEDKHKKWEGHIVSRFEAVRRKRVGAEIVKKNHGPGKEFVFSLAGGEHVVVPSEDGEERLLRVTVISGQQVEFVENHDARPITVRKKVPGARIRFSTDRMRKLGVTKVAVDPLGKKWPAGD